MIDLTKTGPLSYRELQRLNKNLPEESLANQMTPINTGFAASTEGVGKGIYTGIQNDWGESKYDSRIATEAELADYQHYRGVRQSGAAQLGAGLLKGIGLAATTFLEGTVGLVYGIGTAIAEGRVSGIWDNDFNKAMNDVTETLEKELPNYYTNQELEGSFWDNLGTANFWGDKVLKNVGFSVGAIYSGGLWTAPLKTAKFAKIANHLFGTSKAAPVVAKTVGSTLSAVTEGSIEALNNSNDWAKYQTAQLDEMYNQNLGKEFQARVNEIMQEYNNNRGTLVQGADGQNYDPAVLERDRKLAELNEEFNQRLANKESDPIYQNALAKINEDRIKMGNMDLAMNIAILTGSNWVQFGHFYSKGFKTATKARVKGSINQTEAAKPKRGLFGRGKKADVDETPATNVAPYTGVKPRGGRAWAVSKGFITEGSEELSQRAASEVSGIYYASDVENFYKAQMDPNAEQENISFMQAMAEGISKTLGDDSAWEEFFIGGLTGAMGIPMFRSPRTDGHWRSPITMAGGIYNSLKEYNEQVTRNQEIANYLNNRVQSPEFLNYYRGLIRHRKYQNDMNVAAEEGDEFNFKNAEHAQFVSDIIMFDNAGKLNDLISIVDEAMSTTDENLDAIIRNTTSVTEDKKLIGPYAQFAKLEQDGSISSVLNESNRAEMTASLNKEKKTILDKIQEYKDTKDDLELNLPARVEDDQMAELTWMGTQVKDWQQRAKDMTPLFRETLLNLKSVLDSKISNIRKRDVRDENLDDVSTVDTKANEVASNLQGALNIVNSLLSLDNDRLTNAALNSEISSPIIEMAHLLGDDLISNLDINQVYRLLSDFPKIGDGIKKYKSKLEEYVANPAKQAKNQKKAQEEVAQQIQNSRAASLKERLQQAPNINAFKQALAEESDLTIRENTIKELENEGNQVAKNYRETSLYDAEVRKALAESGETEQTVQDAIQLWENHANIAENLEQISNDKSVHINDSNVLSEANEGTPESEIQSRFETARYALQNAMTKVNNDTAFKNRFAPRVETTTGSNTSGSTSTNTTGTNNNTSNQGSNRPTPTPTPEVRNPAVKIPKTTPVGNTSSEGVKEENKALNDRVPTQRDTNSRQGQRRYYNPTIPELHIDASREGDFRPFDEVVKEREGKDYSKIYDYLKRNGAFDYINNGNLKVGDTVGFMIDPAFEEEMSVYDWYEGPTIFFVKGDQILGDVASLSQAVKYEGLEELIKKVKAEYDTSRHTQPTSISIKNQTRVSSKGRIRTSEVHEVSRTVDREGTTIVELEEVITSDSEKQSLVGRKISHGGLEIPLNSDIIDWKRQASSGRRTEGGEVSDHVITPEEVTPEEEQDEKEQMEILLENMSGQTQPFYASTIYYSKDGRIIAKDKKGNFIYLKSDPLSNQSENTSTQSTNTSAVQMSDLKAGDVIEYQGTKLDVVGYDSENKILKVKDRGPNSHEMRIKEADFGNYNILELKSVQPNKQPSEKQLSTNKFYATPKTKVSKIMIGKVPYSAEERSLNDIPGVNDSNTKPLFGVIKNGILDTNGKIDDRLVIKPVDMSQKEGRLYLLIPNANGTYSPVAVRVKHFNRSEFNLDDTTIANTPMGKSINEAIDRLATATSQEDVSEAMRSIVQDLYSEDVLITWFSGSKGNGIAISKKIRKPDGTYETIIDRGEEKTKTNTYTIYFSSIDRTKEIEINGFSYDFGAAEKVGADLSPFFQDKSAAEIRNEIINVLTSFNLPLQVRVGSLNDPNYNNRLIKSNILTSNLREARVIGSWFTTDYFDKEGNTHQAENPVYSRPTTPVAPSTTPTTPVDGTESAVTGTKINIGGTTYTVNLKSNYYIDSNGRRISRNMSNQHIFDLAWAQENYGDNTESSVMTENKIITPSGRVLDRSTGRYLSGNEALRVLNKIQGNNKGSGNKVAEADRVEAEITENQNKVDKTRTDKDYYYIQEEDGEYHPYDRVHKRLGSNWVITEAQNRALGEAERELTSILNDIKLFNGALDRLSSKYGVDLSSLKGKNTPESIDTALSIIRDKILGVNSKRAIDGGTIIDKIIREFFTTNTIPAKPDMLSEEAFSSLISTLTDIKARMATSGETFLANNIVLFKKYPDGTRVAGEVDILSRTKDGDFKIYDIKTSRYSFYPFEDRRSGERKDYFRTKSDRQIMSTEEYYTLQLSAYQNLFESQYGIRPVGLGILPFVLTYDKVYSQNADIPKGTKTKLGLPVASNQPYFKTSRKVDDEDARFISSERDGKIYFKPILDTEGLRNGLKSIDATRSVIEFEGGDYREATSFILLEPGEATRDSDGNLVVTKKAKLFAITPNTPFNPHARDIITSIRKEKGIPITYNPAVSVPVDTSSNTPVQSTEVVEQPEERRDDNNLPIFDMYNSLLDPISRVIPENAFEGDSRITGNYEFEGKLYTGIFKKIGEIEITLDSGQVVKVPIHITKARNGGLAPGSFTNYSRYYAVLPNGKAILMAKSGKDDNTIAQNIMVALSKNPSRLKEDVLSETQIAKPEGVVAALTGIKPASQIESEDASKFSQWEDSINDSDDEFEDDIKLREVDNTRPIWNEREELKWLAKVLPQLSEQDRVRVVKGLIQVAENGPVAWGMFSNGIITLSDIAAKGTTYHEAFHVVFNLMLNDSEKTALFEEARKIFGNKSLLELEEDMAEGFREYVTSQENRSFGRRILDFFKNLFAKVTNWKYVKPSLYSYYRMINQGKYRSAALGQSSINRLREEEYTSEMNEIKSKAIADGTFMKAPNGNLTNLNERQWLQVRTKNFINWFGDWINNPSEASKVVDENGEPLVVYHSSPEYDITIFKDTDSISVYQGLSETEEDTINRYKKLGYELTNEQIDRIRKNDYDIFTNPIILTKPNAIYASSNLRVSKTYITRESYEEGLYLDGKVYPIFLNIRDSNIINGNGSNWDTIPYNGEIFRTRDLESKFRGIKDGIIIKNIFDFGTPVMDKHESNLSDIFIVYKPNQIKSATSNTGEFSTTNNDIRYRVVDNLESAVDNEYNRAKEIVKVLNNRRYNTEQEALDAFNRSGIHKDFFYRITRPNANNATGYKIQILTKEAFNRYKDSVLEENRINREARVENRYFDSLDSDTQMELLNKGWTKEQFDRISQAERDNAIECTGL